MLTCLFLSKAISQLEEEISLENNFTLGKINLPE